MKNEIPTIRGDKWRSNYRAQVIGILGGEAPHVSSRGKRFYNADRWTLRFFTTTFCKWAKDNPGSDLTEATLRTLVDEANLATFNKREIVIARTPDKMTVRTALALIGGADHEAFHSRYSRRDTLRFNEVRFILDLWPLVPDWSRFHKMIQTWSNVVEDIRIERIGREEYPGTFVKLHDLQDFILKQEAEGEEGARSHGVNTKGALSIVMRVFRDVGLGYVTPTQEMALEKYRADNPEAVDLVLDGPLSESLREAMALGEGNDVECLQIAMEVITILYALSQKNYCPKCGALGSKLTVRPKKDANGNKVPGKAVVTCSVCGWEGEMDIPEEDDEDDDEGYDDIRFEDPNFEDFDKKDKGGSGGQGNDEEDGDEDDSDDSGDDSGSSGEAGDEGQEEDQTSGGKSGASSDKGDDTDADASNGAGDQDKDDTKSDDHGAGGHQDPSGEHEGNDWSSVADEALDQAEEDLGVLDSNTALEEAVNESTEKEDDKKKLKYGESPYRPYDQSVDTVEIVGPSKKGRDQDRQQAQELLQSVKTEASFLRARLRQIVRALEMNATIHGVRKGKRLSSRYLTNTKAALKEGIQPRRAFRDIDERVDTSLAVVVEIDESYSMTSLLKDATRMLCALTEPPDALGAAVMAAGFRNGDCYHDYYSIPADEVDGCHRLHGVTHDVFKTFDESFRAVKHRFANTRAEGSTPMADGIQFGLDALDTRKEAHRVLFVITDGEPDMGHEPVIRRQIRLAKEAGIHVIGVGVGRGASGVKDLFPDHVYSTTVREIPRLLIAKLNELVDASMASKRGRRMKKTG